MSAASTPRSSGGIREGRADEKLQRVLLRLVKGSAEQQAIEAGEIDAIIDYSESNVILFPAAQRALRKAAKRVSAPRSATNGLLAALPRSAYLRLRPDLEPVALKLGQVLHEPGAPIRYVYFPVDSVVCLLATADGHRTLAVGLTGYEGMVGTSVALGVNVPCARAVVHTSGTAMRMPEARFREELRRCKPLQREVYRFTHTQLALASQTVACNSVHLIEERLARWLLMASDRVRSDTFFLTQSFVAGVLGVRRVSITNAASDLQGRKLISYHRGHIRILDREGLEAASCRCYAGIEGGRRTSPLTGAP